MGIGWVRAAPPWGPRDSIGCQSRQVRDFARSLGRLARADRCDRTLRPGRRLEARPVSSEDGRRPGDTRRQVVRRRAGAPPAALPVVQVLDRVLALLDQELKEIDADLSKRLRESPVAGARGAAPSVPGVGPTLTFTLVAEMPERTLTRRQIAALVGVAPLARAPVGRKSERPRRPLYADARRGALQPGTACVP